MKALDRHGNKPETERACRISGLFPACASAAAHAMSALEGGDTTAADDGDAAGEVRSLAASAAGAAPIAALPAAAAAVALATMAANDVLGGGRSDGRRAEAVDGKTGSWNTFATRI